jgi:hypothetical protein
MYYQQLYELWAPPGGLWTPWVKPVLFAQLQSNPAEHKFPGDWRQRPIGWAPSPADRTAIIIDLPGADSVLTALALADKGYRPVPLFNCCLGPSPVLNLTPVVDALNLGNEVLSKLAIPYHAPPAFVIDSRRSKGDTEPTPGKFDNRWVVLPQDFPSARFMLSHGVQQAVVAHHRVGQPETDLAHVLRRWQEAGINILRVNPMRDERPAPLQVARPSHFREMWYTFLATVGLRRNAAGGFGSAIPIPSSSDSTGYRGGFG